MSATAIEIHHCTAPAAAAFLVMTALGLAPAPALGEADGPDFYRVVDVATDDVLNIRAEPHAASARIGQIPSGADCVRNLGCRGGLTFEEFSTSSEPERAERLRQNPRWCRIEFEGVTGWVAGRYLAEGRCTRDD